jgi:hypothetical protein
MARRKKQIEESYNSFDIVESLHIAPAGGELPPRFESAKESSFRIHYSSLNRTIWNPACRIQGGRGSFRKRSAFGSA